MTITIREVSNFTDYMKLMKDFVEIGVEYYRWLFNYLLEWRPEAVKKRIPLDEWLADYDKAERDGIFPEVVLDGVKQGFNGGRWSWLLYENNQVAGMVTLTTRSSPNEVELQRMYVRPTFRGKKFSSRLIEKVLEKSKAEKFDVILLQSLPFMEAAIHLYENHGFKKVEYFEIPYMDREYAKEVDAIFMELRL